MREQNVSPIPNRNGNNSKGNGGSPSLRRLPRFKMKWILTALPVALLALGVYTVDTGQVAVEKTLGKVDLDEIGEGLHWHLPVLTKVRRYNVKNIAVDLLDMRPKAADNLSLQDLDVSLYYKVDSRRIADSSIKYAQAALPSDEGLLPLHSLVRREARGIIYDAVADIDSLQMHRERSSLSRTIMNALQARLDSRDEGVVHIDRVVIRALNTDPTIEQSIQRAVQNQKLLEAKQVEVEIAEKDAEIEVKRAEGIARANGIINESLTAEYLQHEVNEALKLYGANGCPATIIPANMEGLGLMLGNSAQDGRSRQAARMTR